MAGRLNDVDEIGETALHAACRNPKPIACCKIIQLLIKEMPSQPFTIRTASGKLALHLACEFSGSVEAVQLVLQGSPTDARSDCANNAGELPLHCAARNQSAAASEILELILAKHIEAASTPCKCGKLPLEHAAACCSNGSVLRQLLAVDSTIETAVLLQLAMDNSSLQAMQEVLRHEPTHPVCARTAGCAQ